MRTRITIGLLLGLSGLCALAQDAVVLEAENIVQSERGRGSWSAARPGTRLGVGDRVRTRQRSRALVRVSELYTMRMDQFTTVEISPRITGARKPTLNMARDVSFIFSRERDGEIDLKTPTANAALRGTQLMVEVGADGKTSIAVLQGRVDLSNAWGRLVLNAGESGEAERGKAPRRTAVIEARNLVQWALYYPGILSVERLAPQRSPSSGPGAVDRGGDPEP